MPPSLLTSCGVVADAEHVARGERADDRLRVAQVLHRLRDLAALDEEQAVAREAGDDLRLRVEDAVVPEVGDEQPPLDAGDQLLERLVAAREEQVAGVAAEGLLADRAAGGLDAGQRRAATVVGEADGDAGASRGRGGAWACPRRRRAGRASAGRCRRPTG